MGRGVLDGQFVIVDHRVVVVEGPAVALDVVLGRPSTTVSLALAA
jgi:hypothetical protein